MKKKIPDDQPKLFNDLPEQKIRTDFPITVSARKDDPATSKKWAQRLNPNIKKNRIVLVMYRQGKMSLFRAADLIGEGDKVQNVSPLFAPMVEAGLIKIVGEENDRSVYELTDVGREYALQLIDRERRK